MSEITEAIAERRAIVTWLLHGGTTEGYRYATLRTRLKAAWLSFRSPWALAQGGCKLAALAIERGDHRLAKQGDAGDKS